MLAAAKDGSLESDTNHAKDVGSYCVIQLYSTVYECRLCARAARCLANCLYCVGAYMYEVALRELDAHPRTRLPGSANYLCADVECSVSVYGFLHVGRYRSKQFYESEILKGHIELGIDKVVMYGIAGSGKTSALTAMLGREPLTIRCSTPLMKRPINVRFMCVDEKTEWKVRSVKQMKDAVAEVMHSRMPEQKAEAQSSASPASPSQQPSPTTPSQSLRLTSEKTNTSTPEAAGKSTPTSEKKPPDREQSEAEEVSLDSLLQSSEVDEEFVSLINSAPPSSKPILRLIQTLVLDSGGQPQFHELMPVFLNGASEFVYVFKVNESLDARSMVRYFDKEGTLVFEFPASQTNEETLKQCTCSMSSLTAKKTDIPSPTTAKHTNIPPPMTATNTDIPPPMTAENTDNPPPMTTENTDIPSPMTTTNTDIPSPMTTTNTDIPPPMTAENTDNPPPMTTENTDIPSPMTTTNTDIPSPMTTTNTDIPPPMTATNTDIPPTTTAKNTDIPLPKWLFLATHRDMVADDKLPGVLDTLHKKLREILLPKFKDQIIFCNEEGEDFIFTMNAAKPEKKDKECAEAIRKCLSGDREGRRVVVKVPLRWHALYYKLVEVSEGLGKKVLSREQCERVAGSIRINEGSCEEALNFFNRLNMLFYFPDILADLVFIDPQIVLDKVTELVEESYRISQGKKNQSLCPISGDKLEDRLKFRDYGQVTEKFLSGFESHYEAPLFTPKELVTLLKGLLVFADLSEEVYFMPCLLQVVSSEVVAPYRVSEEKALAVHFPKSGPLMGMFCCTVAYLLSPDHAQWEVVKKEAGTPICLNRNVIQFTVPKVAGTVSLIDQFTHFEIHVHTHPKKTAQMWKLVHDTVFAGMKEAKKTLGYVNNTPVPAIVCPAHPATPHPATIDGDLVWTCSKGSGEFGGVAEGSLPWWTICNTDGELL